MGVDRLPRDAIQKRTPPVADNDYWLPGRFRQCRQSTDVGIATQRVDNDEIRNRDKVSQGAFALWLAMDRDGCERPAGSDKSPRNDLSRVGLFQLSREGDNAASLVRLGPRWALYLGHVSERR